MLTPKQKRFCEEYVVDLNGTQAAIRAGFSKKTANEQAVRLLANVSVADYIKQLQEKLREKTGITAEMVVNELAKIGFCNLQDYIESGNSVADLSEIPREQAAAVSSIKVTRIVSEDNERETVEFKLHDKKGALDSLGKHLGIFERDNKQKAVKLKNVVIK